MSGLGVVLGVVLTTLALLGGAALVLLTPRTWRMPRPRPPRASPSELAARARARLERDAAEIAPAHPLRWPVTKEGGVYAARDPLTRERHVYSVAACGWVRA